jgi:predicted helicase
MTDDTGGAQAERSGRRQRRARLVDITLAGLFLLLLASSLANLYLRREANRIKKDRPVMVVIGNPPYKERSHGQGAWIESGTEAGYLAPLARFIPPADWGVGAHVKHLYNLYVYFWRWATWKVFDHHPEADRGVVCFISVAGFLDGPGFQRMREYLRRRCDAIWVIDCSPEGHQPPVPTRIFEAVQQPVCIVLALRDRSTTSETPAPVRFHQLTKSSRADKFTQLANLSLDSAELRRPCRVRRRRW